MILATLLLDLPMVSTSYVSSIFGDFLIASIFLSSSKKLIRTLRTLLRTLRTVLRTLKTSFTVENRDAKSRILNLC